MEVCEKVPKSELDAAGYKIVEGDKPPWTEEIELPVAFTSSSVENFQMHNLWRIRSYASDTNRV